MPKNKIKVFLKNSNELIFRQQEELIHPSKRDYSNITSSDLKYCASIFYRGWRLKTQTLYSQYKWFEQFKLNILSRMNSSHFDENGSLIDGSTGVLEISADKILVKYAIIENTLYITIRGENRDQFIKRGTEIGFEYGTINQAGKTVRSRKLQTWGFLDFIQINKKSPREQRIFEINLNIYEDYKNEVNYIVYEKIAWINYSLNKKQVEKPITWSETKSSGWIKQTKNIRNDEIRNFFFDQVKPIRGYESIISSFHKQEHLTCIDAMVDVDLCLAESIKLGKKGFTNYKIDETVNLILKNRGTNGTIYPSELKDFMSQSDKYLALKGLKRIEVDNENYGAATIFINRMKKQIKEDIRISPLFNYGILTQEQCDTCKFEMSWGLMNWKGYRRSDTFAPDILVTNGLFDSDRKVFAVIQLKGQTRKIAKFHVTSIFFQILELKKYQVDADLKIAMVIIDPDIHRGLVKYKWLVPRKRNIKYESRILRKITLFGQKMRDKPQIFLDPLLYRNTRSKDIVKLLFELVTTQSTNFDEIERLWLNLIIERIFNAYNQFANFTSTIPLIDIMNEKIFTNMVTNYVNFISPQLLDKIKQVKSGKIDNYPALQNIWNYTVYKQFQLNFMKYLDS